MFYNILNTNNNLNIRHFSENKSNIFLNKVHNILDYGYNVY